MAGGQTSRTSPKGTRSKTGAKKRSAKKPARGVRRGKGNWLARLRRWTFRGLLGALALALIWIAAYAFIPPPTTPFMLAEARRLGGVEQTWTPIENVAPDMARSVVAAEDANFCLHWGFDMTAIREALDGGANRGASTLTQQVVKNAFLWHGRSYMRKALEALITPVVEAIWTKRRIVEVYLNIAEFDEGVFGVAAAADHYFGISPDRLNAQQSALLAAILPSPKTRSAARPGAFTKRRAAAIRDGAATIRADERSVCIDG